MGVIYNRYDERSNLFAVASVTAKFRVVTNTRIERGVGDSGHQAVFQTDGHTLVCRYRRRCQERCFDLTRSDPIRVAR